MFNEDDTEETELLAFNPSELTFTLINAVKELKAEIELLKQQINNLNKNKMAITYKWDIPQMNAHIQAEGEDNVIYTVHYRYTGSEESGGKTYSSTNIGTQSYTYVAGDPFVPYADTEAFET